MVVEFGTLGIPKKEKNACVALQLSDIDADH
jgi:hypothetical protein